MTEDHDDRQLSNYGFETRSIHAGAAPGAACVPLMCQ